VAVFEAALQGLPWAAVGHVTETGTLRIVGRFGAVLIETELERLKGAWQEPLNW
jgi:hypothetical protein